jgi:nitrate/TMAO reductase-like tetraheme cytochrome c subunit
VAGDPSTLRTTALRQVAIGASIAIDPRRRATEGKKVASALWNRIRRPAVRYPLLATFVAGAVASVVFLGGFNSVIARTNTLDFCVSCHEMRDTVYQEYQKSPHYENPSGVRVTCSDCHVPKDWPGKMKRKLLAANDVYHSLLGTIDTKEKFEARRLVLAERVWARMAATDSAQCRSCHDYHAMDFGKQSKRGSEKMRAAMEDGKTCIECHKGVAHKLPVDYEDDD